MIYIRLCMILLKISHILFYCFVFTSFTISKCFSENTCDADLNSENSNIRYLLYEVQPGEGFNLRRDVYLRVANLVKKLNENGNWTLVLPPWGSMYHWKNEKQQRFFPWRTFFDIPSLEKWVPVIEMEEFLSMDDGKISATVLLQHYAEGWGEQWEEKYEERPCLIRHGYRQSVAKHWNNYLWGHDISMKEFSCMSFQGQATTIIPYLQSCKYQRSIFIDHAEVLLHDVYGGHWYWSARRSMRFAKNLVYEARQFRTKFLNSSDEADYTISNPDWREDDLNMRNAIGGPYIAVHLRRRDFINARPNEVPTLKSAARQIIKILKKQMLKTVFISTDAPLSEYEELERFLSDYRVFQYRPTKEFLKNEGDGSVAIVDQIICSHARYFIGSYESTFSFRIQEEREILKFPVENTFNRLCGNNAACVQPSQWKIVYR